MRKMIEQRDRLVDPGTKKTYVVIALVLNGSNVILKEVGGGHQVLMTREDLKEWEIQENTR